SVTWYRPPTDIYFSSCSSRASRLQPARKKEGVLKTDHDDQERRIHKHTRRATTATILPTERARQNIVGLAATSTRRTVAPAVLGQDRLSMTGWPAEWNMPARPLWTLTG
ncbi:hypothetical protein IscW_ISCW019714, partial [Ixodes scapularis]